MGKAKELSDKAINALLERIYKKYIKKFYAPTDFEAVENWLRYYAKDESGIELKECHKVRGMRELRALHNEYRMVDCGYAFRTEAWCHAVEKCGYELEASEKEELSRNININACACAIFENGDFAILDTPIEHHIINDDKYEDNMMLHNSNGPSILFADGSKLYTLKDVDVPEWCVETAPEDIDIKDVLALENVDQRAVVTERIGVQRMIEKSEIITEDKEHPHGPYALRDFSSIFDGGDATYLTMVCPSTGNNHLEGVPSEIDTIQGAINWRAKTSEMCDGRDWKPRTLDGVKNTDGNDDMDQQGDVYMLFLDKKPKGGKKQKTRELQGDNTIIRHTIESGTVYNYDGYQVVVHEKDGVPMNHPQHGTVYHNKITKLWTGRELDPLTGIVRDAID